MKSKILFALALPLLLICIGPQKARAEERKTYIRMKEVEIIGTVEHPEITYIIPRTRILFKPLPLERSFAKEAGRILDPAGIDEEIRFRRLMKSGTP